MNLMRLLVVASILASAALADEIILKNGSVIRGELVGWEGGKYTVRIGKFEKSIPDSEVADVRPTAGGSSSIRPATTPVLPSPPAPAAAGVPGAPGRGPVVPTGQGAPSTATGNVGKVLDKLGAEAGGLGEPGQAASIVQQIMGRGGRVDPAELEALKDNPFMNKLVDRFADPNYQKSLLDGIQEMQDKVNPGQPNPMAEQLKGLFDQLNQARQAPAPARPAGP